MDDKQMKTVMDCIEEAMKTNFLLQKKVEELKDSLMFLEAEVLALGNTLINSKLLDYISLARMTELVLKQKVAERKSRENMPIQLTKKDLDKILNKEEEKHELPKL